MIRPRDGAGASTPLIPPCEGGDDEGGPPLSSPPLQTKGGSLAWTRGNHRATGHRPAPSTGMRPPAYPRGLRRPTGVSGTEWEINFETPVPKRPRRAGHLIAAVHHDEWPPRQRSATGSGRGRSTATRPLGRPPTTTQDSMAP